MPTKEQILEKLKNVAYPGFDKDIVSLGAVESVDATPDSVTISVREISADAETLEKLSGQIKEAAGKAAGGAEVHVLMKGQGAQKQAHPPAEGEALFVRDKIPGVKHIVPITSGKGGVGKSTVAVNLAYTLSQLGNKVGILDLDIFGPSVHRMLGAKGMLEVEGEQILPYESKGLKIISVGMAVPDDDALILRGPMVMKLLNQLMGQVKWGDLDYLIVDLPPGTGDVPLSLVQQLDITGAIVVTTPQDISLIDVRRAISMFNQTQTHIMGIVENMSHYVCEKCGEVAHIFGKEGGVAEAGKLGVPLLAQIPLVKSICESMDAGNPIFDREKSPELAKVFEGLAGEVVKGVEKAKELAEKKSPFQSAPTAGGGG